MSNSVTTITQPYPTFTQIRLYLVSALFVTGNITLPVILHQFGIAGQLLLPLYFFSLIGGLMFGYRVGIVTGFVSPLINFYTSGMPPITILPFILIKSIILGGSSGFLKERITKSHWLIAILAVTITQLLGIAVIYTATQKSNLALADLKLGYSGLLLQITLAPLIAQFLNQHGDKISHRNSPEP